MGLGIHYGLALASKRLALTVPLTLLLTLAMLPDLLLFGNVIVGLERMSVKPLRIAVQPFWFEFPYSHSLVGVVTMAAAVAAIGSLGYSGSRTSCAVCALVVFSHWGCDYLMMDAALPLTPTAIERGAGLGLGLHRSRIATFFVDMAFALLGWSVFESVAIEPEETYRLRRRRLNNGFTSSHLLWAIVVFEVVVVFFPIESSTNPRAYAAACAVLHGLVVLVGMWLDMRLTFGVVASDNKSD